MRCLEVLADQALLPVGMFAALLATRDAINDVYKREHK